MDGLSFARALLAIGGSEEARLSGYLSPMLTELSDARFCNYVLNHSERSWSRRVCADGK